MRELYNYIRQENRSEVILINKNNTLITSFGEIIIINYHILYIWCINKNIIAGVTKFFKNSN